MIKKILLSLAVIGTFLGYAYHENTEEEEVNLNLPNQIPTTQLPQATPTALSVSCEA